jgi:hypothetical protein
VQNLPNPHHEFLKTKYLFEEGKFVYDVVFLIGEEHLQADWNLHRKTGKNHPESRNQLNYHTSQSYSFLHRSQNHASQSCWKEGSAGFL